MAPRAPRIIGYVRVSTAEQADSGLGMAAQVAALEKEAAHRGWKLTIIRDEGRSGASLKRPGIRKALTMLAQGKADGLAVAKLDRLSRSTADSAMLFQWCNEAKVALIALDFDLDTSTPTGQLIATFMAALAEWERQTIAARTKASLAALRAQGKPVGPPAVADDPPLTRRIKDMRAGKGLPHPLTFREIADTLNREGVPTPRGGSQWRPSSLQRILGYERPTARKPRTSLPKVKRR